MSETARIIVGMGLLVTAFLALLVGLGSLFSAYAPAGVQQAFSNIVTYAGGYISTARGLVNQFVLPGSEWIIDLCLQFAVFFKPALYGLKLAYRVCEYFVKGY